LKEEKKKGGGRGKREIMDLKSQEKLVVGYLTSSDKDTYKKKINFLERTYRIKFGSANVVRGGIGKKEGN